MQDCTASLKMKALSSPEPVNICQNVYCHVSKDGGTHFYSHDKLKSYMVCLFTVK